MRSTRFQIRLRPNFRPWPTLTCYDTYRPTRTPDALADVDRRCSMIYSTTETQRWRPSSRKWKKLMNGERCMLRDSNLYPRIISATPDLNIILSKLFDMARRWSTTVNQDGGHPKPQIRIERTGRTCMPDSNGYSIICDHAGHVCDTADIDRRCSYQNSRWRPPLSVSNLWLP